MHSFLRAKFTLRAFLLVWYVTIVILLAYGYLVQKSRLPFDNTFLTLFVEINLLSGIVYLVIFLAQITGLKKLLIFGSTIGSSLLLIYYVISIIAQIASIEKGEPRTEPLPQSIRVLADARQFYLDLFFDVFGYPPDDRMSTAKELFDAANKYRSARALPPLQEHSSLCQIAKADFQELYAFASSKNFAIVRHSEQKEAFGPIGEIIQSGSQPNLGKHIVGVRWARSFSQQKEILEDPEWQFGCGVVSEFNVVFVFGKY